MPLIKREVEPILVSQVDIDKSIKDELECVSNYTLASIIRQLGNLGKHAEDIFGDLFQEASGLAQRATNIQNRMEKIGNYLDKLDPMTDSVSMRDINSRIAFTSSMKMEKEVVSSPTMPSAMKDTYNRCQQTPPLSKLSKYREDGKDALKFYTDPKFFFERWLYEQHKDIDKKKKKKKKRPQSKLAEGKPKKVITRKQKFADAAKGKELMEIEKERERAAAAELEEQRKASAATGQQSEPMDTTPPSTTDTPAKKSTPSRRAPPPPTHPNSSMLPPPPPPPPGMLPNGSAAATTSDDLPPPPPPDAMEGGYASIQNGGGGSAPPPPPPPPPPGPGVPAAPPLPGAPPAPAPPPIGGPAPPPPPPVPSTGTGPAAPPPPAVSNMAVPNMADAKAALKSAANRKSHAPAIVDTRDGLLSAIRSGMQLRKVDKTVKQQQYEPQDNSVEAILRRRIALELSDDDEDESMYDSEEDEWSD